MKARSISVTRTLNEFEPQAEHKAREGFAREVMAPYLDPAVLGPACRDHCFAD